MKPDTEVNDSHFGAQLRAWRVRHGISLRELANSVHIDYGHLGKVERGSRTASRSMAEACDAVLSAGGALRAAWKAENAVTSYKPAQLPPAARSFAGRYEEVRHIGERLTAALDGDGSPVLVVSGPPGVGKSALVLRCANDVAARFPDGLLFADLRGFADEAPADPHDVLEQFLLALGVPAASVPRHPDARAALYRSVLYDRQVLVVLDNAGDSEQTRRLIPAGQGCAVLVTSRIRLSGLIIRHDAHAVELPPLRPDEAVNVLRGVVGAQRVDAEPEAAVILAGLCSHLPLALRVAAERLAARPRLRLGDFAEELATAPDGLSLLAGADDASLEVRRVFSWSYRTLEPDAAYLFRLLGLDWADEISLPAAAALAGWSARRTGRCLDVLTGAHLLQEVDRHRYRYHDLLQAYAAELVRNTEGEEVRRTATERLLRWHLNTAGPAAESVDREPPVEATEGHAGTREQRMPRHACLDVTPARVDRRAGKRDTASA